ncbi:MAG TPA: superoxide dismutase family protein [Casimicrobiaceae bacterium]|nr:superoxide dismutase family protein [Casimicrobiaceae bacterium]
MAMRHVSIVSLAVVALAGCADMPMMAQGSGPNAVARLEPTQGNKTAGTVQFQQRGGKVRVIATVTGLAPNQVHGFHVHEKGDCSSGDGNSAGGHFNPDNKPHGPQNAAHHAGDMPSLQADASGNAKATFELEGVTIAPGPMSFVGRGLIVHKDPDDYKTQPTGNAGARLACAVIRAA